MVKRFQSKKHPIVVYTTSGEDASFQQFLIEENKLDAPLKPESIVLYLDPNHFTAWIWCGRDTPLKMRIRALKNAKMIVDDFEHQLKLKIPLVQQGQEPNGFLIMVGRYDESVWDNLQCFVYMGGISVDLSVSGNSFHFGLSLNPHHHHRDLTEKDIGVIYSYEPCWCLDVLHLGSTSFIGVPSHEQYSKWVRETLESGSNLILKRENKEVDKIKTYLAREKPNNSEIVKKNMEHWKNLPKETQKKYRAELIQELKEENEEEERFLDVLKKQKSYVEKIRNRVTNIPPDFQKKQLRELHYY